MQTLFFSALGLGVAYNAAPGAVNAESVRRGLARGFRPALLVQLGALIGDTTWAALALTGTAVLLQNHTLRLCLGLAGACFLLWVGWSALREARSGAAPSARSELSSGDFATGAFFSLANPFAVAFWLGIGGGLVATGGDAQGGSFALLLTGFVIGASLWCLGASAVIGWGRRFVGVRLFQLVNLLCGLALGYFGLSLGWSTLRLLHG